VYKETFGERLKKARLNAGFTQKDVEKAIGIKQTLISRYESGVLEPNIEILGSLIDLYNEDANYIISTRGKNVKYI
jgi:transcriptional regulator with XRE-family HTH domain